MRPWTTGTGPGCVAGAVALAAFGIAACVPAAPAQDAAPDPPAALARADADVPHLSVTLTEVARVADGVIEVRFALVAAPDAPGPVPIAGLLASAPDDAGSIADVYLVDAAAGKKYFVVRDAGRHALSSRDLYPLQPGESRELWVRLAAPPPDVVTVGVQIPHVPLLANQPIQAERARGPAARRPAASRGAALARGPGREPVRRPARM